MDRAMRLLAFFLSALALQAGVAAAQTNFYAGKTVTIIVGFSPGGGYDAYDRALARHMGKYIPGNPTVIVQNMPGAGSLTAVRSLEYTQPKDGTVMLTFNPGLITHSLVEPENVKIDFRNFSWVGIFTPDFRVCFSYGAQGIKSWAQLMEQKQFVLGTTAKGDGAYINGAILREVFNAPVKQILGFPGSAERRIAIERGELDGDCGTFSSVPTDWLEQGTANSFIRFTRERLPEMPESAVFINDLAKTPEQTALLDFLNTENEIGRVVIMSGKVPADRLAILREAFNKTVKDPDFIADLQRQKLPLDPATGEEAQRIIERFTSASPEIVARARKLFQ
jgi:tripartite-type tricarboxylate transporter receptor subunit TctC